MIRITKIEFGKDKNFTPNKELARISEVLSRQLTGVICKALGNGHEATAQVLHRINMCHLLTRSYALFGSDIPFLVSFFLNEEDQDQ